eukprot:5777303-Pyramimonas_sp.AAC.1
MMIGVSHSLHSVATTRLDATGCKARTNPYCARVRPLRHITPVMKLEMDSSPLRVAIAGAGICGLATAVALHRKGLDVTVYERATELKGTAGTVLCLFPNGLRALRLIDPELLEAVKDAGSVIKGMIMGTGSNGVSQEPAQRFDNLMESQYGEGMVGIRWASLQSVLASFFPPERLHLDSGLKNFTELSADRGLSLQL